MMEWKMEQRIRRRIWGGGGGGIFEWRDVGINHALHEYTALRRGVTVSEVMVGGKKMAACCGEDCIPSYLLREGITYRFFEAGEVRRAGEVRERFEG